MLMPPDDINNKNGEGYLLSVHRSDKVEENDYLFRRTSHFIKTHPEVRDGENWDGVGKMVGIGEHHIPKDGHCNFVEEKPCRKHWSLTAEKLTLSFRLGALCNV